MIESNKDQDQGQEIAKTTSEECDDSFTTTVPILKVPEPHDLDQEQPDEIVGDDSAVPQDE